MGLVTYYCTGKHYKVINIENCENNLEYWFSMLSLDHRSRASGLDSPTGMPLARSRAYGTMGKTISEGAFTNYFYLLLIIEPGGFPKGMSLARPSVLNQVGTREGFIHSILNWDSPD